MMTAIEALQTISDYINKQRMDVYNDIGYANKHNFKMESMALTYKSDAYSDINGEILMLIHKLSQEEDEDN